MRTANEPSDSEKEGCAGEIPVGGSWADRHALLKILETEHVEYKELVA